MESTPIDAPPSDLINRPKVYANRSPRRTAVWGIILLLSTLFLAASMPKLGGFGFFDARFERWGYPYWFELLIGMAEASAAIFLIIPSTAFVAAIALGVIMIGAIITHLAFGEAALALIPLIMLGFLAFVGWNRRPNRVHRLIRQRKVGNKRQTPAE